MMMLWVLFGGLLLVGSGFIIYHIFFVEEEEELSETPGFDGGDTTLALGGDKEGDTLSETLSTTTEEYKSARKSRMIALKESLEASLEVRHGTESASSKDRMSMPWFMLVGSDGSGKTTLLANTGLSLPYGPAFEVDSRKKDAGRWWLYEDAVVLEAPPAAPGTTATGTTLTPDQTAAANTSDGWNTLLHMLRRERPDSPLNGIIVTVSATDLIASRRDPDKLTDQAERVRTFLERTRRVLGVRLPLHLLVTKCDALPGFRSFATNLPADRRHDIFGWANPNKIETPFNPDWVDLGVAALKESLDDLRDELLAAPDEIQDSDGLFVFVSEFGELHEPLKDFVTKLIGQGERRPPLFFRGMYFSGDALDTSVDEPQARKSGERSTLRLSSDVALSDVNAHNLVFLRSLFRDKIFKEAGLARPVARFRLSRDRRVVIAQVAAVLVALIGGLGLWTSLNGYRSGDVARNGLRHDAEALSSVLAGMAIDLDEVKRGSAEGADSVMERRMRDAAVIDLVGEMREVESIRKSPFIPASWFSPLPDHVRRSMIMGIESIVLPVTRQRLTERLDQLLRDPGFASGTPGGATYASDDPRSLTGYLREMRALSRNIARYNALATADSGSVPELAALLEYLFSERPIRGDSAFASDDFVTALRFARAPRIVVTPEMAQSVMVRSLGMVTSVARSAAGQLAPRPDAAAEASVRPEDDIAALRGLSALVALTSDSTGLVATVSDSAILGVQLTATVQDSIAAELRAAALAIGRDSIGAADAEMRLRSVLTTLFHLPLMDTIVGRSVSADIPPGQRMRWDAGRLELALSLRGDYDQALLTVASAFQGRPLDRMRRAFQVQLRARAIDAAASAQRFTPLRDDPMIEVKASIDNLDLASTRILRTAILLDTLEARAEGRRLVAAGARQAEQALALAWRLFEDGRYFEPDTLRMAAWLGVQPLNLAAMGVPDSLALGARLMQHVNGAWAPLADVEKAIAYLRRPGMDSTRAPRLLDDWSSVVTAVRGYEQGDATSTLMQLYRFISEAMATRDLESCRAALAREEPAAPTVDVFIVKRQRMRAAMAGRCEGAAAAAASYERLRALFASRLAGRFPFVDSSGVAVAPDLDPTAIREFYRAFDAFIVAGSDIALRSDPRLAVPSRDALDFLHRVARTRKFMAPMMDNDQRAPSFGLMVGDRPQAWSYGQPLFVMSVFADSADRTVQGGWAPVRFAAQKAAAFERVRFFHPDLRTELALPEFPAVAPFIAR
ncbi:MAG: type VI secretion system protein [Gemmatimonadaceae bacterium]